MAGLGTEWFQPGYRREDHGTDIIVISQILFCESASFSIRDLKNLRSLVIPGPNRVADDIATTSRRNRLRASWKDAGVFGVVIVSVGEGIAQGGIAAGADVIGDQHEYELVAIVGHHKCVPVAGNGQHGRRFFIVWIELAFHQYRRDAADDREN